MKTEKQKVISGELYNALDPELSKERLQARLLINDLNTSREDEVAKRKSILSKLFPKAGANLWLEPPFYCDYGYSIELGDNVFFNFNCVVLDVMKVSIGSRTLFGPNVQIHPAKKT